MNPKRKIHVDKLHHKTKKQTKKKKTIQRNHVETSIHEPSEYPKCSQDISPSIDQRRHQLRV